MLLCVPVAATDSAAPPSSTFDFGLSVAEIGIGDWFGLRSMQLNCREFRMQPTVVECTRGVIAVHAGAEQGLRGEFSATHRLTTGESSLQIDVAHADGGHFTAHFRRHSQNWLLELTATGINATLLKAVLSSALGQLITDEQGTISVTLQAAGDAGGIRSATGRFAFDALAFDGTHVAEALSGAIKFALIHRAADWFVEIDATLTDGIVYFEPGLEIRGMAPGFTLEVTGDKHRARRQIFAGPRSHADWW